jgi:hypothetical protein
LVGFFALLPGTVVWLTLLSLVVLARRFIVRPRSSRLPRTQVDAQDAA